MLLHFVAVIFVFFQLDRHLLLRFSSFMRMCTFWLKEKLLWWAKITDKEKTDFRKEHFHFVANFQWLYDNYVNIIICEHYYNAGIMVYIYMYIYNYLTSCLLSWRLLFLCIFVVEIDFCVDFIIPSMFSVWRYTWYLGCFPLYLLHAVGTIGSLFSSFYFNV